MRAARLSALLLVTAATIFLASRRYQRIAVTGTSMLPTYRPGDWLLIDRWAYRRRLPRRGEVVVARDPRAPGHLLMKRVEDVDLHGAITLAGDNVAMSTDSRAFGAIGREALVGRVVGRYWAAK